MHPAHSNLTGIILLLATLFHYQPIRAASTAPTVASLLEEFDRAGAKQQRLIAARYFEQLHHEKFLDKPYILPAGWPIDSVRAEVWYRASQYYFDHQDFHKCVAYADKGLSLLRGGHDSEKTADCMSNLSSGYFRISDYTNAIKYAKEVLDMDLKAGDNSVISSDLSNIAAIYLASRRPKEALPFALKAIKHSTEAGDSVRMAIQMGITSEIYQKLADYPKALDYASRAYKIDHTRGNKGKAAIRLCQMAAPLVAMNRGKEAEAFLLQALPVLEETGNRQSYSIACNQLGSTALAEGHTRKAAEYFNRALPFFTEQGDFFNESKTRMGLYQSLKASSPSLAMEQIERYCTLQDSLNHREMQEAISEFNAKYRNDELRQKYEYEGRMRNATLWISAILILLSASIIILLLYVNRQRKQKHDIIRRAENMRTNFFTNITHEFRTPLTVIQSASQDILNESPDDSRIRHNVATILHHEHGLLQLINQILDIAKIESVGSRDADWRNGNIVEFISIICESYRSLAADKGIELSYNFRPKEVVMDFIPDFMQKIMQNLISNAIKFSTHGSKVLVATSVKGHNLKISVTDKGIGMTGQQMENIFKPFYQASNDTGNVGTGIGLSLVKLAVESMEGSIEVQSAPDKGSEFVVTLPLHQRDLTTRPLEVTRHTKHDIFDIPLSIQPSMPDDDGSDSDEVRILIIEDAPEVATYMKRLLNPDYSYYFAANGITGLDKATQLVPDLIITDVMMPEMDGFELCRQVRGSELLNHIPVIMVTAKATHADRMLGLDSGADAYIEKPFRTDELNMRVEKLLEQRRMLRDKYASTLEKTTETTPAPDVNQRFLGKFTEAVKHSISQGKIDYDALAYGMCLSRAQLNRKIKAITGYTTTEFILETRITLAKHLLDTTDAPIYDIAMKCGMDSDSYFCTLFKKSTGLTPLQYRTRAR